MSVDNETSPSHSMLTLRCRDRKGLLYDLFRSLKDLELRCVGAGVGVWMGRGVHGHLICSGAGAGVGRGP